MTGVHGLIVRKSSNTDTIILFIGNFDISYNKDDYNYILGIVRILSSAHIRRVIIKLLPHFLTSFT